jgi:hypothetical protein
LKSLGRAQNCALRKTVVLPRDSGSHCCVLASLVSFTYMGVRALPRREGRELGPSPKSLHGAAGMKEPRKSPPRESHANAEAKLDEAIEESFPASDPPANTPTSIGGPARAKRPAPAKPRRRG